MSTKQQSSGSGNSSAANKNLRVTGLFIRKFLRLIRKYQPADPLITANRRDSSTEPAPSRRYSLGLTLLSMLPWVLAFSFLASFFWDFNDSRILIIGNSYPLDGLLRIVSVSGLIGFLTNWLAITMLFRPSEKRPILGQGLLPAQKERVARRLATAVSEDLINPEIIKSNLRDSGMITRYREYGAVRIGQIVEQPEFRRDLKRWLIDYTETILGNRQFRSTFSKKLAEEIDLALENRIVERTAFKTYSMIRGVELADLVGQALDRLPSIIEKELYHLDSTLDTLPEELHRHGEEIDRQLLALLNRLINRLDVHSIVKQSLMQFDHGNLEKMILRAVNEQLKYIQYLGALLGTIGGLVIWQPQLSLLFLTLLGGSVYLADRIIHRFLRQGSDSQVNSSN